MTDTDRQRCIHAAHTPGLRAARLRHSQLIRCALGRLRALYAPFARALCAIVPFSLPSASGSAKRGHVREAAVRVGRIPGRASAERPGERSGGNGARVSTSGDAGTETGDVGPLYAAERDSAARQRAHLSSGKFLPVGYSPGCGCKPD